MEVKQFRLECGTKESDTYIFNVKIPPKTEIIEQLDKQKSKYTTENIQFSTGILYNVQHAVKLIFAKPGLLSSTESPKEFNPYEYQPMAGFNAENPALDIFIFVCLLGQADEEIYASNVRVKFISASDGYDFSTDKEMKSKGPATKESEYELNIPKYQHYKYFKWSGDSYENSSVWSDKVTEIRFTMNVIRKEYKPIKFVTENPEDNFLLPFKTHQGMLNTTPLFLSSHLSDTTIQCEDQEYPAHRLILSMRSKYFANHFLSSDQETLGKVVVNDCDPILMKEMLRFIYTGEVDDMEGSVKLLFWAADRYLVDELHMLCERHLVRQVSVDNATDMYAIGSKCNGKMLVQIAKKIILSNRETLLADSESFKRFTTQYPELMFELFHTTDFNLNLSK